MRILLNGKEGADRVDAPRGAGVHRRADCRRADRTSAANGGRKDRPSIPGWWRRCAPRPRTVNGRGPTPNCARSSAPPRRFGSREAAVRCPSPLLDLEVEPLLSFELFGIPSADGDLERVGARGHVAAQRQRAGNGNRTESCRQSSGWRSPARTGSDRRPCRRGSRRSPSADRDCRLSVRRRSRRRRTPLSPGESTRTSGSSKTPSTRPAGESAWACHADPWCCGICHALQEDARQRQPAAPDLGDLEKLRRRAHAFELRSSTAARIWYGPGSFAAVLTVTTIPCSLMLKGLVGEGQRHFPPPPVEHAAVVADRHHQDLETRGVLTRLVDARSEIAGIDEQQRSDVRTRLHGVRVVSEHGCQADGDAAGAERRKRRHHQGIGRLGLRLAGVERAKESLAGPDPESRAFHPDLDAILVPAGALRVCGRRVPEQVVALLIVEDPADPQLKSFVFSIASPPV